MIEIGLGIEIRTRVGIGIGIEIEIGIGIEVGVETSSGTEQDITIIETEEITGIGTGITRIPRRGESSLMKMMTMTMKTRKKTKVQPMKRFPFSFL
jgi:hypothetical protein